MLLEGAGLPCGYSDSMRSFLAVLALTASAAPVICQSVSVEKTIRGIRTESNRAIQARDINAFASSLSPDALVVTGNGTELDRKAYVAAFAGDFKNPRAVQFHRLTDSVQVSEVIPVAAEHGHWTGTVPGGQVVLRGTYLAMWRKSSAGWQIRSELFVVLECAGAQACEAYRHAYEPASPQK